MSFILTLSFCFILVWGMTKSSYKKPHIKAATWEEAALLLDVNAEHVAGWFRSQRDIFNNLGRRKSG